MLKELNIKGYRKLRDITFANFNRINVITGSNNIGKSSVLKAVFAWSCGLRVAPIILKSIAQPQDFDPSCPEWLLEVICSSFNDRLNIPLTMSLAGIDDDPTQSRTFVHRITPSDLSITRFLNAPIYQPCHTSNISALSANFISHSLNEIPICSWHCRDDLGNERKFNITSNPTFDQVRPHIEALYIDSTETLSSKLNASLLNRLKIDGVLEEFTAHLQSEFKDIQSLDIINYEQFAGPVSVYLNDGTRHPLYTLGSGVQRFFNLLGASMTSYNRILCIEEPEQGLNSVVQEKLCSLIITYACKNKNQIFLATKSQEFIDNMLIAAQKIDHGLESMSYYSLSEKGKEISARYLSGNQAYHEREALNKDQRS